MMTRLVNETVQMGGQGCSALLQPHHTTCQALETEMLAGILCPGSLLSCPPLPQPFCRNLYFCPLFPLPAICASPAAPRRWSWLCFTSCGQRVLAALL